LEFVYVKVILFFCVFELEHVKELVGASGILSIMHIRYKDMGFGQVSILYSGGYGVGFPEFVRGWCLI
jgi:hypothetical protein